MSDIKKFQQPNMGMQQFNPAQQWKDLDRQKAQRRLIYGSGIAGATAAGLALVPGAGKLAAGVLRRTGKKVGPRLAAFNDKQSKPAKAVRDARNAAGITAGGLGAGSTLMWGSQMSRDIKNKEQQLQQTAPLYKAIQIDTYKKPKRVRARRVADRPSPYSDITRELRNAGFDVTEVYNTQVRKSDAWKNYVSEEAREGHRYLKRGERDKRALSIVAPTATAGLGVASLRGMRGKRGKIAAGGMFAGTAALTPAAVRQWKEANRWRNKANKIRAKGEQRMKADPFVNKAMPLRPKKLILRPNGPTRGTFVSMNNGKKTYRRGSV